VLTGAGRGFCAGMDLKAFAAVGPPKGFDQFIRNGARKPLIAAVEGFALAGGLEVALTCDLVVAAKGIKLGIPEAGVGLFAAGGALLRLPRRLPYGVAMEMALTADPITAEQAFTYGLVTRLAEKGEAATVALELAERIARNAPLSVAASKQVLRDTQGRTEEEFWDMQAPLVRAVFSSADAKEGPRAFAEKRPPSWSGR
jgi:enoyl-CoA hydratase